MNDTGWLFLSQFWPKLAWAQNWTTISISSLPIPMKHTVSNLAYKKILWIWSSLCLFVFCVCFEPSSNRRFWRFSTKQIFVFTSIDFAFVHKWRHAFWTFLSPIVTQHCTKNSRISSQDPQSPPPKARVARAILTTNITILW